MATGNTAAATVTMADGTSVATGTGSGSSAGVPTVVGILGAAHIAATQYTCNGGPPTLTCTPVGGPANCAVTYTDSTGAVNDTSAVAANC